MISNGFLLKYRVHMDVNIRFLAALSLILNIFFAVNFFGFLSDQTEPNQPHQAWDLLSKRKSKGRV